MGDPDTTPNGNSGIASKPASGTVEATFTWLPDSPNDVAPAKLDVLETGYAGWGIEPPEDSSNSSARTAPSNSSPSASSTVFHNSRRPQATHIRFQQITTTGNADDGIGSPYVGNGQSGYSSGTRFRSLNVSGGKATTGPISLSASCVVPPGCISTTGWSYSVQDASLTISRGIAAKRKGASGVTVDEDVDEWIDTDGTGHGNTTFSYWTSTYDDNGFPARVVHPNAQQFTPTIGVWPSTSTGAWTPPDDNDTLSSHRQDMPMGTPEKNIDGNWVGSTTAPNERIITYTIASNTGATARAAYKLKVHDEWEIKGVVRDYGRIVVSASHPSNTDSSNPIYDAQHPPAPKTVKYGWSEESTATEEQSYTESKDASLGFETGIDASKTKLKPFLEAGGIDLSVKGDAKIAVASEDKSTQLNSTGFHYSVDPEVTLQPGQFSKPLINVWAYRKVYKLRHWNESGFAGDSLLTVTNFDSFEPRWEDPQDFPAGQGGPGGKP